MSGTVTAIVVCHDGKRWLPLVLRRLAEQTHPPHRVVVVDTGSTDGTADLLRETLGSPPRLGSVPALVVELPPDAGYPQAVRAGLEAVPGADDELVWLLHDDSAPAPEALERLVAAADVHPDVTFFGPKLREWPDLRRLLEVGVTITGTGRRETGLERGEHDQGQHDEEREVLAVGTAGLLARRSELEALGLDDRLPVTFTDLDLGWRAAAAGLRTRVVPAAVVFHAEASHTGIRDPGLSRAARTRRDRAAATWTLLTNVRGWGVPLVALRQLLGSLLRALGLLLVRAPGEAVGDVAGVLSVLLRPDRLVASRRAKRRTRVVPATQVRPLLAPWWTPYRHGLDEIGDIGVALARETGLSRPGAEPRDGVVARLTRSPASWAVLVLVVAALWAGRDLWSSGAVGGALLPAPDSASSWWQQYGDAVHRVGGGSAVPAPAYLPLLGVLGTLLLGSATTAATLLLIACAPVAAAGGARFLRRLRVAPRAAAWGGLTYGLLLATTGAWAQGRLGTLVAATVLPWLASSSVRLARAGSTGARWRAAWGTAVWLAVGAAFAPVLWLLATAVVALLLVPGLLWRPVRRVGPALLVPPVGAAALLVPWSVGIWSWQGISPLLLEAGTPRSDLLPGLDSWDLLSGRAGDGAAPVWVTAALAAVALLALLRRDTRAAVTTCWAVAALGLATAAVLAGVVVPDRVGVDGTRVWTGLPLLVAQAAWVTAIALAATGLRASLADRSFGWRQPLGVVAGVVAAATPVLALGWWAWQAPGDELGHAEPDVLPAYMVEAADRDPAEGTLVLRGTGVGGYRYEVGAGHTLRLGEEAVLPPADDAAPLTDAVTDLVTAPAPAAVDQIRTHGVAYVFAPAPVDGELTAVLDGTAGLAPSAPGGVDGRAWQVVDPPSETLPDAGPDWLRPLLLAGQALLLLVALVLAAPSRRRR